MPIVLASNEVNATDRWDWKDVTGVRYHFPNQYKNLIKPGERFVYYKGMRRLDGTRRQAEYFGAGTIGDVWRDPHVPVDAPKRNWAWFCTIEDYQDFGVPVPSKRDGVAYEDINPNLWRNGVRRLAETAYAAILDAAVSAREIAPPPPTVVLQTVVAEATHSLILPRRADSPTVATATSIGGGWRRSKRSKLVGDAAEVAALKFIAESIPGAHSLRHVAGEGETPGWDIEYLSADGATHRVEVKGTQGKAFASFELTANELASAQRWREQYWIFLVADCMSAAPVIQRIGNPASLLEGGQLWGAPAVWRIWANN